MILIENRKFLASHNRHLLNKLSKLEEEGISNVWVENTKSEDETLKLTHSGKFLYLHSKYNPKVEAERLMAKQNGFEKYKHVLFIGVGLGYQIENFIKKYPDIKFSIYEPNLEVLLRFLSKKDLNNLSVRKLQTIFTSGEEEQIRNELYLLDEHIKNSTYIFTLPAYEKLYIDEIGLVTNTFKEMLKSKRSEVATNTAFQKRWTLNAIKNFPVVLKSANILHDVDKNTFKDKPAIIVAAGPSLNDEIDNIKYIKENGLAYIFSVGSAINALINNGVYPDAACTYDPSEKNQVVLKAIKERNISNIPLVFGSTVGFETLEDYPGPLLHMITNQDTVSSKLLNTSQDIEVVFDAPSIAVVTFQLLTLLGFNTIILVGQNLSFQNNKRYASGIQYDHLSSEISEEDIKESITVKGVHGELVLTNDTFMKMQNQLEMYIKQSPNVEVINTSKGGAHIEGTKFMPLSDVIITTLKRKQIVSKTWFYSKNHYDKSYSTNQLDKLDVNIVNLRKYLMHSSRELKEIESLLQKNQLHLLEEKFVKFDRYFSKLKSNLFYQGFIEPMVRVQNKRLAEQSKYIRFEKNLEQKGELVVKAFGTYLNECNLHVEFILPYFEELKENIYLQTNDLLKV
ncbi:motility associated factor glycosyltransferase family protein [Rossellomorea sp. NS-SX7]|uniref:motility associated factor glycosyltransferase family protein n=1 Tax=Rossellomorea sp. NS-SX7 TaxID=3463856 RepID=UPI004059DAD0